MAKKKTEENIEVVNLHKAHRERMDARFKQTGFCGWSDYEILEYLLYATISRGDTSPIAHELIHKFGNLDNVLDESLDELSKTKGIGKQSARYLATLKELHKHLNSVNADVPRTFDISAESTIKYIRQQFLNEKGEVFLMICLDAKNKLIKTQVLSRGTFNHTEIDITTTARVAVNCNAAKVIFAHNHPSGNPVPSTDDMRTTDWLNSAFRTCGIVVLEHVIIAGSNVSLVMHYMKTGELYEEKKKPVKMRTYNQQK